MKILVTGHKGFIGSNIYWLLRSYGYEVYGYDRNDVLKPIKYDHIVHCAANLKGKFHKNVELTKKICGKYDSHIIFTSSAAVYGNTIGAVETDNLNPFGEYGVAKAKEEELIYVKEHTILRLANVYGYNSDHGIYSLLLNKNVPINYPDHIRDFVSVGNVCRAIIKSIDGMRGTYNVSSGIGVTMEELHKKLRPFDKMIIGNKKINEIEYSVLNNQELENDK